MKFAFVRNPWDRLVSGYFGYFTQLPDEKLKKPMTFFEFLQRQKQRKIYQVRRIVNTGGQIDLDFLGRFEPLDSDCKRLSDLLDINFELPHLNQSKNRNRDYRDHYDEDFYNYVCENWSKDIELLGYKFE